MDRLTAIKVFVEVAERSSLTRAAEQLDMSLAMVSRYLAAVEQWFNTRLFHRTTRRISLTEAGHEALPRCRQLLELSEEVATMLGSRRREPVGKLRVSTSPSFAEAQLTAALVDFQRLHSRIEVELTVSDRMVDLAEQGIDMSVRITNTLDDHLVARPLAVCRSVLCASPSYLQQHGHPLSAKQLERHRCVTHAFGSRAEYRLRKGGQTITVPAKGSMFCNETSILRRAALAGGGIAMLPTYYVVDDLRRGTLTRVLPDHEPETLDIHAVYLSRRYQPLALRLLIEWLAERFAGEQAPWDRALNEPALASAPWTVTP